MPNFIVFSWGNKLWSSGLINSIGEPVLSEVWTHTLSIPAGEVLGKPSGLPSPGFSCPVCAREASGAQQGLVLRAPGSAHTELVGDICPSEGTLLCHSHSRAGSADTIPDFQSNSHTRSCFQSCFSSLFSTLENAECKLGCRG